MEKTQLLNNSEKEKFAEVCFQLDQLLTESQNIQDTFEIISNQLQKLLPFDRASVLIENESNDNLTIFAINNDKNAFSLGPGKEIEKSPEYLTILSTRKGIINSDPASTKNSVPASVLHSHGIQIFMMVPVIINNEIIGTFNIGSKSVNQYNKKHLQILTLFTNHIAPIINNSILHVSIENSEKKYRELVECLPATLFEMNLKGEITYANQQALGLFGYTLEELKTSISGFDLIHLNDRERAKAWFRSLIQGTSEQKSNEFHIIRNNHKVLPVLVHATPIYHHTKIIGIRGFVIDLTEQKEMEQALRNQWENFREIFTHIPNGFFRTSPDGRLQLINPQFAELLGYQHPDDLIGLKIQEIPNFLNTNRYNFTEEMKKYGQVNNYRTNWKKNNGEIITVRVRARIRQDEKTKQHYYEGTVEDITEQLAMEQQLIQAQKMDILGEIGGGIAHDFNNVLATISGACQLMEQQADTPLLQKYFNIVKTSVQRGQSITSRLTSFARSDEPEFTSINLNHFIHEIVELISLTLPKNITIESEPLNKPASVTADKSQLQQVVLNLCINAIDAMPDGGRIKFTAFEPSIQSTQQYIAESGLDYLCLSVADNGSGIGKNTIKKVFDPFFTTKPKGKGTGLGLAIAYRIMNNHHGWIDVKSRIGKGTTFILGIPRYIKNGNSRSKRLLQNTRRNKQLNNS